MSTSNAASQDIQAADVQNALSNDIEADPAFTQDDWEFELDTMQVRSISALEEHLARAPVGNDTAGFLKGFLMDCRGVKFTPFND